MIQSFNVKNKTCGINFHGIKEKGVLPNRMKMVTGIQYAGSHLRELQNAFKHPATHLTLILEEVTKRGLRSVGLGSVPALEHYVDPQLKPQANLLAKVQV